VYEAGYLLCGLEPPAERTFAERDRDAGGAVGFAYRALKDATLAGSLPFIEVDGALARRRLKPADAVAWAMQRGLEIPEPLHPLRGASPPAAREPEAEAQGALSVNSREPAEPAESWRDVALRWATEVRDRDLSRDLHPSIRDLSRSVAKRMREEKRYGPQGKPLSAEYIARHALRGAFPPAPRPASDGGKRGNR
jgi:hypothetical protein